MKNQCLLIALCLASSFPLVAQLFPVRSIVDSLSFEIVEKAGRLALRQQGVASLEYWVFIDSLRLEDADLVLDYHFTGPHKKFSARAIEILGLIDHFGRLIPFDAEDIQRKNPGQIGKKLLRGQCIWPDAAEDRLYLGQTYTLMVRRSLWEEIDCEGERPTFGLAQKWPHFAGAGAAGIAIGLGQFFRSQKEKAYMQYQSYWEEGRLEGDAKFFLDEAVDHDKTAKTLNYVGWSVLGLNAVWYLYRELRIRNRQKIYDQYCSKENSLMFHFNPQNIGPSIPGVGYTSASVGFTWIF